MSLAVSPRPVEIRFFCPSCAAHNTLRAFDPARECACAVCKKIIALGPARDALQRGELTACLFCEKNYFHSRRDFNKGLGCAILLVAIGFSVKTYGLSLVAAGLVDWILFQRLPRLTVCYVCDSEYKGATMQAPEFDLHLHEKYRKLREEYAGCQ